MIGVCAFPGCLNQEKRLSEVTFHRLPLNGPERLQLWLLALHLDPNSSIESVHSLRVCSEHFPPADHRPQLHRGTDNSLTELYSCADRVTTKGRGVYFLELLNLY